MDTEGISAYIALGAWLVAHASIPSRLDQGAWHGCRMRLNRELTCGTVLNGFGFAFFAQTQYIYISRGVWEGEWHKAESFVLPAWRWGSFARFVRGMRQNATTPTVLHCTVRLQVPFRRIAPLKISTLLVAKWGRLTRLLGMGFAMYWSIASICWVFVGHIYI